MPEQISAFRYCPVCRTGLGEKMVSGIARLACPNCGFILFLDPKVVTVIILSYQEKVLLGRRVMNPGAGQWSFFGGYVDRGEQVEESARREVKEETNLDVELAGFIGIYSTQGDPHILLAYQATIAEDQLPYLKGQSDEVSELAFFGLNELPTLAFPIDLQILDDWQRLYRPGQKIVKEI